MDPKPVCTITNLQVTLQTKVPEHGIRFIITGTKPAEFSLKAAQLELKGDQLWKVVEDIVGSTVVSFAQFAVLPVDLSSYMNLKTISAGSTHFSTEIHFGDVPSLRISHKTLLEKLQQLAAKNDPEFILHVWYGEKGFGFSKKGTLMHVQSKMSSLLQAATSQNHQLDIIPWTDPEKQKVE